MALQLHAAPTPALTTEEIVEHARQMLGADHAGITLLRARRRLETIGATDALVTKADHLQYELDEGPCRDSTWHGQTLASHDLAADSRWPCWAPQAASLGIASVLSAELIASRDGQRIGSLNLYWASPVALTSDDLAYATIFATHSAVALDSTMEIGSPNTALDARKLIGQAQGILMERHGLTADHGFEVLRRYSSTGNIKLRDIAHYLVNAGRLSGHAQH